jgi:outer membrane protein OmpA-like peptidoglycan-associated protein
MKSETDATAVDAPRLLDRPEPSGFWDRGWPLLMLAVMTALLVRACIPSAPPAAPAFDTAAAARAANERAMAALAALPANAPISDVVRALNLAVVNFASGSAEIPPDARAVLAKAAAVIAALPANVRLEIGGHTDDTGMVEGNLALSQARAQAVLDALAAAGAPRDRLLAKGYGDARPIASNATEEGRFHNRRIEFAPAN